MGMTREQAAAAVAAAAAERDSIQANLLDLDGSFGKRLLAGATLTGETRQRWDTAVGVLACSTATASAVPASPSSLPTAQAMGGTAKSRMAVASAAP